MEIVVVIQCERELNIFYVADALGVAGALPCYGKVGDNNPRQYADYGDDHQELYEGKALFMHKL